MASGTAGGRMAEGKHGRGSSGRPSRRSSGRWSDRGNFPHPVLPAVLDPVGVDEGHAADRRFPVRQQDGLRLFASPFLPVLASCPFSGRILGSRARARRRRGVPPPRQRARTSSSADRPARRPHPDARRRALHQRRGGAARARRRVRGRSSRRRARSSAAALRQRAGRASAASASRPRFTETLPGGHRPIQCSTSPRRFGDDTPVFTVPEGIISSWATTATIQPTAAYARPWAGSASCRSKT